MKREDKFLLEPAEGEFDEDQGMTRISILRMLAEENGLTAQSRPGSVVKFSKETFLLVPAENHVDEENGLTRTQMIEMLANEIGCDVVPAAPAAVAIPEPRRIQARRR